MCLVIFNMLGNNLKWCREKLGMTQAQLGNILGVSRKTVSGWETANDPIPLEKLMEFCEKYNYSLDYAVGLSKKNYPSKLQNRISKSAISRNLKETRKELGLSQEKFASSCGLSQTTYSHYETGYNLISTTNLYCICKVYNISMDYMASRTDIKKFK